MTDPRRATRNRAAADEEILRLSYLLGRSESDRDRWQWQWVQVVRDNARLERRLREMGVDPNG